MGHLINPLGYRLEKQKSVQNLASRNLQQVPLALIDIDLYFRSVLNRHY